MFILGPVYSIGMSNMTEIKNNKDIAHRPVKTVIGEADRAIIADLVHYVNEVLNETPLPSPEGNTKAAVEHAFTKIVIEIHKRQLAKIGIEHAGPNNVYTLEFADIQFFYDLATIGAEYVNAGYITKSTEKYTKQDFAQLHQKFAKIASKFEVTRNIFERELRR